MREKKMVEYLLLVYMPEKYLSVQVIFDFEIFQGKKEKIELNIVE